MYSFDTLLSSFDMLQYADLYFYMYSWKLPNRVRGSFSFTYRRLSTTILTPESSGGAIPDELLCIKPA